MIMGDAKRREELG